MNYFETDIEPQIGDIVTWAGAPAEVMEVGGLLHYKQDGTPDDERGIANELLIKFENGSFFQLDPQDSPDLEFVSRKGK